MTFNANLLQSASRVRERKLQEERDGSVDSGVKVVRGGLMSSSLQDG